jgi:cytochrome P450
VSSLAGRAAGGAAHRRRPNRDPAVFEQPGPLLPDRQQQPHLAFVNGIHFCSGAALARLEGRIGLQRLFRCRPQLQLGHPGAPARRRCCAATARCRRSLDPQARPGSG